MLLVPGGRGEHDVGQQRGGGHAEVRGDQQVQLPLRGLLAPAHVTWFGALVVLTLHAAVRSQQVLEEVFLALGRGAQEIGTPQHQRARPVLGGVRVLDGEVQTAVLEPAGDPLGFGVRLAAFDGAHRRVRDVQRVLVELREERHPAQAGGLGHHVRGVHALEVAVRQRGLQRVRGVAVRAPLVRVHVPEGGADHEARGPHPVVGGGHGGPARDGAGLLLSHVVRPATAVAALAAAQHQHGEDGAVGGVPVVPLAHPGAQDDHGTAVGFLRVGGELTSGADHGLGRHRRDLLLPRGGVGGGDVLVVARPLSRQAIAPHAVLGEHEVEHGGHGAPGHLGDGNAAVDHGTHPRGIGESGQVDRAGLAPVRRAVGDRQRGGAALQVQVPLPLVLLVVPEAHGPVGHERLVGLAVQHDRLEGRIRLLVGRPGPTQVLRGDELVGNHGAVLAAYQRDEEREVRVLQDVVLEERDAAVHEVLLEDHVSHGHGQGAVAAGLGGQPLVRELGVVRVVRAHGDHLGTAVAHLGEPVGVRGAGHGNVGAPHHEVGGVPPVTGLGNVRLVPEHLRRGHGQVRVPVVEAVHHPADQVDEPGARSVRDHGHGGDRRETGAAVRAVALDGVHVGRGRHLHGFLPAGAHQPALAAGLLERPALLGIIDDGFPREHRVPVDTLGLAVHLQQHPPDVRVAHAGG